MKTSSTSKDFQKFMQAAKALNISVVYYNPSELIIEVDNIVRVLDYNMEPILVDGIINWIPYDTKYLEIYEAFSSMNIPCINSVSSVRNCRNKLLTNIILNKHQIPQPKTLFIPKLSEIPTPPLETPIVFKKKNGSRGIGAYKFDCIEETTDFLQEMLGKKDIYLQEYIQNNGWDIRVIVVGNKVIGGIKKIAKDGEWRTHVAHGGHAEYTELNESIISMCLQATKALNLDFTGIDIIQDLQGKYSILEVNSVPGMSIFFKATGINIAYEILAYFMEEILDYPIDISPPPKNYYQIIPSKMKKTQIIMQSLFLRPYIPQTLDLNINNLKDMLDQFAMVVFKPDIGGGGKYVGFIKRSNKKEMYTIHYKTTIYDDMTMNEIINFIGKLAPGKNFILQKGIDLIRYNDNTVDVRVFIQKPYSEWEVTGAIARIAAKNKMVTNLCNNGTGMSLNDFFNNMSYGEEELERLHLDIYDLTYAIADTLSDAYPALRELGVDIGIDNDLNPWVLEVNTRPRYSKLALFEDKTMYNKIDEYNKIIHSSVDYYDRSSKIIDSPTQPKYHLSSYNKNNMLVESRSVLETSLAHLIEAESKKIQYLMDKDVCPEILLEMNNQMERILERLHSLDKQLIEEIEQRLSICEYEEDEA